jgi:uncharacterized protein YbjT (DUF2867 family)
MKIVVIGCRGLIGSEVVTKLSAQGHHVVTASRRSGVDSLTGDGLANALAGADVVVDVADSPLFDDEPVMHFFTTTTTNLLSAEREAGVKHHVALSVVGAQVMPGSGYNTAKAAQEIPCSFVLTLARGPKAQVTSGMERERNRRHRLAGQHIVI